MKFLVNNTQGFSLGKVIAKVGMMTPYGMVRKVNAESCYIGDEEKATDNRKFSVGEVNIPIYLLRDDEIETIEFNKDQSLDNLSSLDKAMILFSREDEHAAIDAILEIATMHISNLKRKERKAKLNKTDQQEKLFDQYNDMTSYSKLAAIQALLS